MTQRPKFSIGYYPTICLLILFLESMFFSGPAVKELPYSKFRDLIQENKVESVIIESDRIYGLLKAEHTPPKAATQDTPAAKKTDTKKSAVPPKAATQTTTETKKTDSQKDAAVSKPGFTPQQKQTPWYLNFEKNCHNRNRPGARKFNANSRSFPAPTQPCCKTCSSTASFTAAKSNRIFSPI